MLECKLQNSFNDIKRLNQKVSVISIIKGYNKALHKSISDELVVKYLVHMELYRKLL